MLSVANFSSLAEQEYTDNLASMAGKTSSSSGLPRGKGRPSSPLSSLDGVGDSDSFDVAGTGTAAGSLNLSPRNALAFAQVAVTGAAVHGIGGHRDGMEKAMDAVGGGVREEGGVAGAGGGLGGDDGGPLYPAQEAMRRMIVHMSESDPYPCVLGIPVKPALFATSKVYVFGCFAVISIKLMYDVISGL